MTSMYNKYVTRAKLVGPGLTPDHTTRERDSGQEREMKSTEREREGGGGGSESVWGGGGALVLSVRCMHVGSYSYNG